MNKRSLAAIAVAIAIVGACLIATIQFSSDYDAGSDNEFTSDSLKYKVVSNKDLTVEVKGYEGSPEKLTIPDEVVHLDNTYKVVKISKNAFKGCADLTSVSIGANVKKIDNNAFSDCKKLTFLNLGKVQTIGNSAFRNCISLEDVVLPDSVKNPGDDTFKGCKDIKTLSLPITIQMNDHDTFPDSKKIETITLTKGDDGKGADYHENLGSEYKHTPWYKSKSLNTLIIAEGVESIGGNTFNQCKQFENLLLPKTLKTIGINAFAYCESIKSVILPDSLTFVEGCAFYRCYGIKELSIPANIDSVVYQADAVFMFCYNIEKVTLTKGDGTVFNYNEAGNCPWNYSKKVFKTLVVEEDVTHIGNRTFEDCTELKDVTLPSTLESIGNYAFKNCSSMKNVTLPNGLTTIKHSSFEGCKAMTSLTLPDSVTELGRAAFKNCTGLNQLTVPISLDTEVSNNDPAFKGCKSIKDFTFTKGTGYGHDYDSNPLTPWYFSNNSIARITFAKDILSMGNNIFNGCENMTALPELGELVEISDGAFFGCRGFETVVLPETVTKVGKNAFKNCTSLKSLDLGNVSELGDSSLEGCIYLSDVVLHDTLRTIGDNTFKNCNSLEALVLPEELESVGKNAFSSNKNLHSLVISSSATSISNHAFTGCENLRELTLPADFNTVRDADNPILGDLVRLEKVTITATTGAIVDYGTGDDNDYTKVPWILSKDTFKTLVISEGVKSIGSNMFRGCTYLSNISLPSSLEEIRENAFRGCTIIREIETPANYVGKSAFEGCSNMATFNLPNLTTLGDYSLKGCSLLSSIHLPETLDSIGKEALAGCSRLVSLTIPENITTLKEGTFKDCIGLRELVIPISINSVVKNDNPAFGGCSGIETVTLTKGTGVGHDYGDNTYTPWRISKDSFSTLVVSEGIEVIGDYTFKNCSLLTSIVLPDSLTNIKHSAFESCKSLNSLTLPDSITELGRAAFKNCTGLEQLTVPVSLNTVVKNNDPAFDGCKKINTVTLTKGTGIGYEYDDNTYTPWHISKNYFSTLVVAEGVGSIGKNTFKGCDNLQSMQFCNGLQSIGENAFKGFKFYDSDGVTELPINAENLQGALFSGSKNAMVKQ